MLMSAVSAEDNTTIDDGAVTSDFIELDSSQDSVSEDSILEDSVIDDDDKNISEENVKPNISPDKFNGNEAGADHGFNVIGKGSSATAGISFNKDFAIHKSSAYSQSPKYDLEDGFNERDSDEKFSNFQYLDNMCPEAVNDILDDFTGEDFSWQADSDYSEYFDYLKLDSVKNLIDESEIGDVFNANTYIIDLKTIDNLKDNLIGFIDAGAKYAKSSFMNLVDMNAFFDIFDKIMNMPTTHNTMATIPSSNSDSTLRNSKYYSDYTFYPDTDSIMNYSDLDEDEELDSNVSDMAIIHDNIELTKQTSDLKAMQSVYIDSYDGMKSDLQISDAGDCRHDTSSNCDERIDMQIIKLSQQANCLSYNMSEDIQHTFYHVIGCECTNTSFTKQNNSYDNLPEVSEFDTVTSTEKEDNHDYVLFKKHNVNAPFIVENTSVFALFGVIKITIP